MAWKLKHMGYAAFTENLNSDHEDDWVCLNKKWDSVEDERDLLRLEEMNDLFRTVEEGKKALCEHAGKQLQWIDVTAKDQKEAIDSGLMPASFYDVPESEITTIIRQNTSLKMGLIYCTH